MQNEGARVTTILHRNLMPVRAVVEHGTKD
jgi:hypothetical protein